MINAPKPPKNIRLVGSDPDEVLRESIAQCLPDIPAHAQPYAIDAIMQLITKRDAEIERVARIDELESIAANGLRNKTVMGYVSSIKNRIKELEQ